MINFYNLHIWLEKDNQKYIVKMINIFIFVICWLCNITHNSCYLTGIFSLLIDLEMSREIIMRIFMEIFMI